LRRYPLLRLSFTLVFALLLTGSNVRSFAQQPKLSAAATAAQAAFFESKVRPVLIASCTLCHSEKSRQGGLRLDVPVSAATAGEMLIRVKGEGGKQRMPVGGELSKDQIAAIEAWVQSGAVWPATSAKPAPTLAEIGKTHWSFQPLKRPTVPRVKQTAWVRTPIDAFILARLESKGMKPNPSATRRELIRRVSYDITGLPPTPEEVAAFIADKSPNAYENLVDRLLASPHYGEKWARNWLDLVRYAETNSYERDNPKPYIYKYRDYVIRAFNDDKPYDQFVKEQIAGDELADSTGSTAVGTSFFRLGVWDDEPADRLQAEFDDLDDIVATTGQAFLGLTLDCARCHDHKLDPIPQKDYYKFVAFFRPLNRYRNGGPTDETVYFPDAEAKRIYEASMTDLKSQRNNSMAQISDIEKFLASKGKQFYNPDDLSDMSYQYYERDWRRIPDFENEPTTGSGTLKPAFFSTKPRQRNEDFSLQFEGQLNVPAEGDYTFEFCSQGGFRFNVDGQTLYEAYASNDGKPTIKVAKKHIGAGKKGISLTYNQRQHQHGLSISWSGPGFSHRPLSALDSCGAGGLPTLLGPNLDKVIGTDKARLLEDTINRQAALEERAPITSKVITVTESSTPPETHILLRGVPTAQGAQVEAGFPICVSANPDAVPVPPATHKSSGRRTALANWIASPENPLTARVIVNRIWQHHFGRGIVRTPSDFGLQGLRPTHPELLDWLASEFISKGWSFKKLHRMILTSNTYKQSSMSNPVTLAKDPQNDFFWRFDMRRLTAEEIRDSMLTICGNINLAMYGPGIYPDIPKEILAAQSRPGKDWYMERMTPEDVNRRSIYIFVKRSLVYPMLASFDLPDTDRPAAARFASTQPTQALRQMNGVFTNNQAEILAKRVVKEVGSEPKMFARRVLSLVQQRVPSDTDIEESIALMKRLQKRGVTIEVARKYMCLVALNLNEFVYLD